MKVPIPFVGWIDIEDLDDLTEMLRKQIKIQQDEIIRLSMENQAAYQKGWADAVAAATARVRRMYNEEFDNETND